ncbi:MAG: pimeloyl-ACP methyl ester carboxylesterase, partial [Kiritimatiellia bacterium]
MTVPTPLAGVQSLTVQTHRLAVHGLLVGDEGVPVVCLHGHLATSTYFEELMLGLPEGLRGVAIDLRGHGGTEPWPIDARAGCDDLVADVHAFVRAQGIGPHHLLAHGVGAAIMWRYLLHYSQDVLSVTAVNPAPPCGYGGSRDESGARIAKDGVPAGAGAVDLEFVRRLAEEDRTESSSSSPAVRLARHLGRAVPRQGALLDAMLGIIVDD